jgi:hypothetical protein
MKAQVGGADSQYGLSVLLNELPYLDVRQAGRTVREVSP